MTGPEGYEKNPFFAPNLPPITEPDSFRAFVLSPPFDSFWKAKIRSWLRNRIHISAAEYVSRLIAQDGRCGVCHLDYTVFHRALAVDHRHADSSIRGLCCYHCNFSLGQTELAISCGANVRWSPAQLAYLRRSETELPLPLVRRR